MILSRGKPERNLLDKKEGLGWFCQYDGDFSCSYNELTSLEGAPDHIAGNFYCQSNKLTSLKWAPTRVDQDFCCSSNKLTSLEGAPVKVGGDFDCNRNPIKSLAGIGSYFKNGYIKGTLIIPGYIESHVLGILLIPELQAIDVFKNMSNDMIEVKLIINKHLAGDRDILECQEELRSAGLREFGKL